MQSTRLIPKNPSIVLFTKQSIACRWRPKRGYLYFLFLAVGALLSITPFSSAQLLRPEQLPQTVTVSPQDTLYTHSLSRGKIIGKVFSKNSNEPLAGANVYLVGTPYGTIVEANGEFIISDVPAGAYEVRASAVGYRPVSEYVTLRDNEQVTLGFLLTHSTIEFPDVRIIGRTEDALQKIPGSGSIIGSKLILRTHPLSTNEILRKVSGVYVRDEEGFGIRPNIGIRGLFPTRSTKVLLLEDGVPFALAPYGDPASYYHPPIHRFNRIEVLKGSGQILFGPQTIGGVINYMTPQPPAIPAGTVNLMMGNRRYLFGQLDYGGRWGEMGFLADYSRKQGDLARDNSSSVIQDLNAKFMLNVDSHSSLTLKVNVYDERSNVTYAGITQIEYEENPYQNQFVDDWFYFRRFGSHLIHDHEFGDGRFLLTTNIYGYFIERDWWRQGNNGGTNSTPPLDVPGARTILNPTRNDGRNREYTVWGVEPRLRVSHHLLGLRNESDIGIRAHFETQDRKQIEGNSPSSRTGVFREDNARKTQAYSTFIQNRFFLEEGWTISAGLRLENIRYQRTNNLNGASGKERLGSLIPGIGLTYNDLSNITLFAGVHRGYAPPRVEDVISNNDGTSVELDAEKSWNYELGIRTKSSTWVDFDLTLFRMDFENQIIPASLAGGSGTTVTNAGRTLHQGLELKSTIEVELSAPPKIGTPSDPKHQLTIDVAYAFLPTAKFIGERYSAISPSMMVTGNRLTYAPKHLLTMGLGYVQPIGLDFRLEATYVGEQFSDDLNTVIPSPNGRGGIIQGFAVWSLSANYFLQPLRTTIFLTVKNLFDKLYIVDRSRGILPGAPRLLQSGLRIDF